MTGPIRRHHDLVIGAALWVLAMAVVTPALRTPTHVARLVVVNPHLWQAHVAISDDPGGDWVGLGTTARGDEHAFTEVPDQGDAWTIRFSYARHHVDLRIDRTRLEHSDWNITIPDDFAAELRAASVPATPTNTQE